MTPTPEELVAAGDGEDLFERARHVVHVLTGKPHDGISRFDVAEAAHVLALLAQAYAEQRELLRELRTARALVLYGEAWLARIDAVLR